MKHTRHCAGCVNHGNVANLKRIAVQGAICPGIAPGESDQAAKLTEEMNEILRQKWAVEAERDTLRATLATTQAQLKRVVDLGHNDDCLFCGFKDKAALAALAPEETP